MTTAIDVDSIVNDIRQKIEKERSERESLISFIASELAKTNAENNEEILNTFVNDIDMKYLTKSQIKTQLQNKVQEIKSSQLTETNLLLEQTKTQTNVVTHTFSGNSSRSYFNLRQLIARLENNKDLTNLSDPVLHFGKRHFNLAKRIFFLQATQNYLSAIKYFTIKDLVGKQTLFNIATEDAIKNVINLINDLQRETEISISELQNYQHDSENWIHNDEFKIKELESKLANYQSSINKNRDELESKLASSINKNRDELESKLEDYESMLTAKLEKNHKDLESKLASSINKNQTLTNDRNRELEIKINENYNELKELIITRDLKTTEFLLEKINKIEQMIKKVKEEKQKEKNKIENR